MFDEKIYKIIKIKNHLDNKKRILERIQKYRYSYDQDDGEGFISNTDWDCELKFNWYDFSFSQDDKKYLSESISGAITRCWFNQYYPLSNSTHGFHDHDGSDLVFIYYLELEDFNLRTILVNPKDNTQIIPNVIEGDLLCFPSNVLHSSPKNNTNTRKTIISFNLNFFNDAV